MSRIQRILSLSIALLMLLPVFSACAGTDDPKPAGTTPSAETTAPDGETTEPVDDFYASRNNAKDDLPEKMDFGGQDVRVYFKTSTASYANWFAESSTDIVEEAIYRRNEMVSDRLNINMVNMSNGMTDENVDDRVKVSVSSFSDDYDVVPGNLTNMLEGYFRDIMYLENVNWDKPWWNQTFREASIFDDRMFRMGGEVTADGIASTYLTFFNKTLMGDIHSDIDIYQVVRDGNWTIDKMSELCDNVYNDNNGDGLIDENDRFGNVMAYDVGQANTLDGGANLEYAKFDEENGHWIWTLGNDRTASFLQKCKRLLFENNRTFTYENNYKDSPSEYIGKMLENTVLFTFGAMSTTEYMRDMPDPGFGILPPPKFDEAQDHYTSSGSVPTVAVPVTTSIDDVIGAFLEAIAAQTYRTVYPAYFDTAVKSKYARDEESAEMLDLIAAGATVTIVRIMQGHLEWNAVTIIPKILCTEKQIDKGMSLINKYAKTVNAKFEELPDIINSIG